MIFPAENARLLVRNQQPRQNARLAYLIEVQEGITFLIYEMQSGVFICYKKNSLMVSSHLIMLFYGGLYREGPDLTTKRKYLNCKTILTWDLGDAISSPSFASAILCNLK